MVRVSSFILFSLILFIGQLHGQQVETEEDKNEIEIEVDIGGGAIFWNQLSANFDEEIFKTETEPYYTFNAQVRFRNVWLFGFGIDYLTNTFSSFLDIKSQEQALVESDPLAQALGFLADFRITRSVKVVTEAKFRRFQGTVTIDTTGYASRYSTTANSYYFSDDLTVTQVTNGQKLNWSTLAKDYELYFFWQHPNSQIGQYLGLKYMTYQTPGAVDVSKTVTDAEFAAGERGARSFGTTGFFNTIDTYTLVYGVDLTFPLNETSTLEFEIPLVLGIGGLENSYFKIKPNYLSTYAVAAEVHGRYIYKKRNFRLTFGLELTWVNAILNTDDKTTLKQDLILPHLTDGTDVTVAAGKEVDVKASRIEFFWGPSISMIYVF